MQGMILAAGFGTRLRPLTDTMPKALVPVLGRPMLAHVIDKFISSGITEIFINAHWFSEQIEEFISGSYLSADIKVIKEGTILGTGGGIFNMLPYITDGEFIVYNTDVICDIDLADLMAFHKRSDAIATMVMQDRETFNQVVIDAEGNFCGLNLVKKGITNIVSQPVEPASLLAFCGIHAISKNIAEYRQDKTEYSIIDVYLKAAKTREKIISYQPELNWFDIGTPEKLKAAEDFLRSQS